jgi:hypothetical protein
MCILTGSTDEQRLKILVKEIWFTLTIESKQQCWALSFLKWKNRSTKVTRLPEKAHGDIFPTAFVGRKQLALPRQVISEWLLRDSCELVRVLLFVGQIIIPSIPTYGLLVLVFSIAKMREVCFSLFKKMSLFG